MLSPAKMFHALNPCFAAWKLYSVAVNSNHLCTWCEVLEPYLKTLEHFLLKTSVKTHLLNLYSSLKQHFLLQKDGNFCSIDDVLLHETYQNLLTILTIENNMRAFSDWLDRLFAILKQKNEFKALTSDELREFL